MTESRRQSRSEIQFLEFESSIFCPMAIADRVGRRFGYMAGSLTIYKVNRYFRSGTFE